MSLQIEPGEIQMDVAGGGGQGNQGAKLLKEGQIQLTDQAVSPRSGLENLEKIHPQISLGFRRDGCASRPRGSPKRPGYTA